MKVKTNIFVSAKKTGCTAIFALLFIFCGFSIYYRNYYIKEVNRANSTDPSTVEVVIAPGESVEVIAKKLVDAGVLRGSKMFDGNYVFYWYIKVEKVGQSIQAGKFSIPKNLNMKELAELLRTAKTEDLWIRILENMRIEEVADTINKVLNSDENIANSKFNKDTFIELAKTKRYDEFEFMKYIPEGKSLEGFLFPDSYLVRRDADAETILKLLLSTFEEKIYQVYKSEITNSKYSLYDLVTMSSMVERESRLGEERLMIADILFRRLETPGWRLEVDATLQYGLGWSDEEQTWWRKNLPPRDTPNEYNTSIHDGLPPTPICSPGVSAFNAVLHPKANDYWYYLHDKEGVVHFAKTLQEHNENRRKFLME